MYGHSWETPKPRKRELVHGLPDSGGATRPKPDQDNQGIAPRRRRGER